MTCVKCSGAGVLVTPYPRNESANMKAVPSVGFPPYRIELCECIRAELAALKAALAAPAAIERAPAPGVIGLFETLGELVDEVASPKKGNPT